jgi:hypothetical protein
VTVTEVEESTLDTLRGQQIPDVELEATWGTRFLWQRTTTS